MTETGKITDIKKNFVKIQLDVGKHCFGCMNRECKKKHGVIYALNPLTLPLEKGSVVKIEVNIRSAALQGLEAVLPPVVGFVAGFSSSFIFTDLEESAKIFLALAVMAVFGAAFYVFRSKFPPKILSNITELIGN